MSAQDERRAAMARRSAPPSSAFGVKDLQALGFKKNISYPLDNTHIGYGVNTPTKYPQGANGKFTLNKGEGRSIHLYVTDVELSLEMGGQAVQSPNVRQFFPTNLIQPTIQISGIAPSSYHYNNLANFVRISHQIAVFKTSINPLITFSLPRSIGFPYQGNRPNGNQTTKGRRPPLQVHGYLQNAVAGGRKENHAPEWQITMMVVQMEQGPWKDELAEASSLETWMEIFLDRPTSDFVKPPSQRTPGKKPKKNKPKNGPGTPPRPGPLDPFDPQFY